MMRRIAQRAASAAAVATVVVGFSALGSAAQENQGSSVMYGGGISGVGDGTTVTIAPGVTISGGDVSNTTGIGVLAGGGSSIGATTGGDESAAVVE